MRRRLNRQPSSAAHPGGPPFRQENLTLTRVAAEGTNRPQTSWERATQRSAGHDHGHPRWQNPDLLGFPTREPQRRWHHPYWPRDGRRTSVRPRWQRSGGPGEIPPASGVPGRATQAKALVPRPPPAPMMHGGGGCQGCRRCCHRRSRRRRYHWFHPLQAQAKTAASPKHELQPQRTSTESQARYPPPPRLPEGPTAQRWGGCCGRRRHHHRQNCRPRSHGPDSLSAQAGKAVCLARAR